IKSGQYADLDALIAAHAEPGWQPARRVVGGIMAGADRGGLFVSDSIAWWRCRELAAAGRLELQDDAPAALSFTQVRAPAAP
ncbi:DUF3658 domain-containing protein, partial [Paraburkholderia sp. SIMBA_050]